MAEPSDFVSATIGRRGKHGRTWGVTLHQCKIDHRYGPNNELQWLVPICGAPPGRFDGIVGNPCKRCARAVDR